MKIIHNKVICYIVWRPPPKGAPPPKATQREYDDSDPETHDTTPLAPAADPADLDLTSQALSSLNRGETRYIAGIVVSEAPTEAQLTYPSPLCEQLRACGFTKFSVLPPLRTALRLRYAPGRNWRNSTVRRLAVALAGQRFYGSSREVIRQYSLKPPRSPVIVEFYDPNSVSYYLPLTDAMDQVDSRYVTARLPQELVCPRPAPEPLPESGGLLGSPPLPYKNMNAILNPWDPYADEDPEQVELKKSGNAIERD